VIDKTLFKIIFVNQGKIYEIFARSIKQEFLYGFVELEELVFGESSTVVVDPSEEKLRSEFADVKRTFIPMHAVVRIDEVDKKGAVKISEIENSPGNVISYFPNTPGTSGRDQNGS